MGERKKKENRDRQSGEERECEREGREMGGGVICIVYVGQQPCGYKGERT